MTPIDARNTGTSVTGERRQVVALRWSAEREGMKRVRKKDFAEPVIHAYLPLREKLQSRLESRHQTHNILKDVTADVKDWGSGIGQGCIDKTMNGLHGSLLVEPRIGSE